MSLLESKSVDRKTHPVNGPSRPGETRYPPNSAPQLPEPASITLSPSRVGRLLAFIIAGLVLLSLAGQLIRYLAHRPHFRGIEMFNLDVERNIPTYFACLILLTASCLLALITCHKRRSRHPFQLHWGVLSLIFFIMAADEAISFHEKLIPPLRAWLNTGGLFYYAWVLPALLVVAALGLLYRPFLLHLSRRPRRLIVLSASIYLTGALALEMIGGAYAHIHGQNNLAFNLLVTIEETLELAGIALFIYTLLDFMAQVHMPIRLVVLPARPHPTPPAPDTTTLTDT